MNGLVSETSLNATLSNYTLNSTIGNLENLETTEKSNLVAVINELVKRIAALENKWYLKLKVFLKYNLRYQLYL